MNRSISKLILLVLTILLGVAAHAQTLPPPVYDSLEWDVADANVAIKGHVTGTTIAPDVKSANTVETVSIHVDETLKGPAGDEIQFREIKRPNQPDPWENRKGPLLIFASETRRFTSLESPGEPKGITEWLWFKGNPGVPNSLPVAGRYSIRALFDLTKPVSITIDDKPVTDPNEVLDAARRIAKEQQGRQYVLDRAKLPVRGYLRRAKEVPAMPHWGLDPPQRTDPDGAYDGKRILAGVGDAAYLWDAETGGVLLKFTCGSPVTAVAFSPDGRHALTGCKDGTLRLWSTQDGLMERTLGPLHDTVTRIEFRASSDLAGEGDMFPEDPLVLTTCRMNGHLGHGADPQLQTLWNWSSGEAVFVVPGVGALFSPNRSKIISWQDYFSYADSWLGVWDLPWDMPSYLEAFMLRAPDRHGNWFSSGSFSPSGDQIVTSEQDGLKLRDARTGEIQSTLAAGRFADGKFTSDGTRILAMADGGSMTLFEASTANPILHLKYPRNYPHLFQQAILSQTGKRCLISWWVVTKTDQSGSLWDLDSGKELLKLTVQPIGFSPDGRSFCAVDQNRREITVWDADTGHVLRTFPLATESNRPGRQVGAN